VKCEKCRVEMEISKGERLSDSQYRQVFQCRNKSCSEYHKPIEVIREASQG